MTEDICVSCCTAEGTGVHDAWEGRSNDAEHYPPGPLRDAYTRGYEGGLLSRKAWEDADDAQRKQET